MSRFSVEKEISFNKKSIPPATLNIEIYLCEWRVMATVSLCTILPQSQREKLILHGFLVQNEVSAGMNLPLFSYFKQKLFVLGQIMLS